MSASPRPVCATHPDARVVGWGTEPGSRRQRFVCLADSARPHAPARPITEDLLGVCVACERDWEAGTPVAAHARYHLEQVVPFLRYVAQGHSLGKAIREGREQHHDLLDRRALITGTQRPAPFPPPLYRVRPWAGKTYEIIRAEEDARLAGDWLDRYGALLVAQTADREWPADKPLLVDATKFKRSSLYAQNTAKAGQPKRGGDWGFAVLAGGVGTPAGFRVVHARAVPDDGLASWVAFFRSIPGRPKSILADRWRGLVEAAGIVWPGITVDASTWHTYDLLRRRFNRTRLYPGTSELVADAEAAFADPDLFRAWRLRAEKEAPPSVRRFLRAEGDAIQKRLEGEGPYATGPIERFLSSVRTALVKGHGRVRNLTRVDIRLGLMAAAFNREDQERRFAEALAAALVSPDLVRLPHRALDGATYEPEWVITARVRKPDGSGSATLPPATGTAPPPAP